MPRRPVTKPPEYFDYEDLDPARAAAAVRRPALPHCEGRPAARLRAVAMPCRSRKRHRTGDMCVHMLDMVRWICDLGRPTRSSSTGGILVQKEAQVEHLRHAQAATAFDFPQFPVSVGARTWGDLGDPDYPGRTIYGEKGTLKLECAEIWFYQIGSGEYRHSTGTPLFEYEKYPEDKNEKDLEQHVASAVRLQRLYGRSWSGDARVKRTASRSRTSNRGHISTASWLWRISR